MNGKYKLIVTYEKSDDAAAFSIWQRTTQVSDWIQPNTAPSTENTASAGIIEISDQVKSITIRKKADDAVVRIVSLVFEKIE